MGERGQSIVPVQGVGAGGGMVTVQGGRAGPAVVVHGEVGQPRATRQPRVQRAGADARGVVNLGVGTVINKVTMKNIRKNVIETIHEEHWYDADNEKKIKRQDKR